METTSYKLCLSSSCGLTQPHGVGERRPKMSFPLQGWLQAFQILPASPWEGDLSPCHEASSLPHSRVAAHRGFTSSASSCPQTESRDVLEDTDFGGGGSGGPGPGKPGMRASPPKWLLLDPVQISTQAGTDLPRWKVVQAM